MKWVAWKSSDVRALREGIERGERIAEIARRLGRGRSATSQAAIRFGLRQPAGPRVFVWGGPK